MELDTIIVGQGISGSCLALELLKRGERIAIFDNDFKGAACLVAAGVLNPITGMRLVKSWKSGVALPFAKKYYKGLEKTLGVKFFYEREILQLCRSNEERELWQARKSDPAYADFLSPCSPAGSHKFINDNFGSFKINFAAWVEAGALMKALKRHLLGLDILNLEKFDYAGLSISEGGVSYRGFSAKKIVFCEGWQAIYNPFFNWLPYRPAKGEILSIELGDSKELKRASTPADGEGSQTKIGANPPENLREPARDSPDSSGAGREIADYILHRQIWLMHHKGEIFRCGSTWDRVNFQDANPTAEAKAELSKMLAQLLPKSEFEIVRQEAGVRPCTATTRPHLGAHPKFKNLYSFNGFGSKGYALSPYFAGHFADYLRGEGELDKEADLSRHTRKFFKG